MSHDPSAQRLADDLEPGTPPELVAFAESLIVHRPLPNPGFRGRLGRHLSGLEARGGVPRRLRARIAACASAGSVCLVVGALGAAGAGPLA